MPIYSRADMNNLIGSCFGEYLRMVDVEVGRAIAEIAPEMAAAGQETAAATALDAESAQPFLAIGERPRDWTQNLSDVLNLASP
jgi:hypothetical protein